MAKRKTSIEKITEEVNNIYLGVENGDINVLDATIAARKIVNDLKQIIDTQKTLESGFLDDISEQSTLNKGVYKGFSFSVSGKKDYIYKGITEVEDAEKSLKDAKEKYKTAFEGVQKGVVNIELDEDGNKFFADTDGVLCKFPEIKYSGSYLTIRQSR